MNTQTQNVQLTIDITQRRCKTCSTVMPIVNFPFACKATGEHRSVCYICTYGKPKAVEKQPKVPKKSTKKSTVQPTKVPVTIPTPVEVKLPVIVPVTKSIPVEEVPATITVTKSAAVEVKKSSMRAHKTTTTQVKKATFTCDTKEITKQPSEKKRKTISSGCIKPEKRDYMLSQLSDLDIYGAFVYKKSLEITKIYTSLRSKSIILLEILGGDSNTTDIINTTSNIGSCNPKNFITVVQDLLANLRQYLAKVNSSKDIDRVFLQLLKNRICKGFDSMPAEVTAPPPEFVLRHMDDYTEDEIFALTIDQITEVEKYTANLDKKNSDTDSDDADSDDINDISQPEFEPRHIHDYTEDELDELTFEQFTEVEKYTANLREVKFIPKPVNQFIQFSQPAIFNDNVDEALSQIYGKSIDEMDFIPQLYEPLKRYNNYISKTDVPEPEAEPEFNIREVTEYETDDAAPQIILISKPEEEIIILPISPDNIYKYNHIVLGHTDIEINAGAVYRKHIPYAVEIGPTEEELELVAAKLDELYDDINFTPVICKSNVNPVPLVHGIEEIQVISIEDAYDILNPISYIHDRLSKTLYCYRLYDETPESEAEFKKATSHINPLFAREYEIPYSLLKDLEKIGNTIKWF